jgi:hypothetical protein
MEKVSWIDRVKMKKYYKESRRIGNSYIQENEGRLTGVVISCLGDDTINLWRQPHWLKCLQGAKVRNWTPIQIIIIILPKNFFLNMLLKERYKGWKGEEEDISSY